MIQLLHIITKLLLHVIMQKSHRANYHRLFGPYLSNELCFRRYLKIEIVGEVFMLSGKSFHTLVPAQHIIQIVGWRLSVHMGVVIYF